MAKRRLGNETDLSPVSFSTAMYGLDSDSQLTTP